jgi:hypothetical protein
MPTESPVALSFKELAELIVKEKGIDDGLWGLFVQFGIGAANINTTSPEGETKLAPAALVPIINLGIQRYIEPNEFTVDAAEINPRKARKSTKKAAKRTAHKRSAK